MTELIRRVEPTLQRFQAEMDAQLPPNAARKALLGLAASVLVMAGLAAASTFLAPTRHWWEALPNGNALLSGLQASMLAAAATALGATPVFFVGRISKRQEAALMAFSAGVMLTAAILALLMPSLEASQRLVPQGGMGAAMLTATGLALGVGLMMGIDRLLPHEHAVLPPAAQGHTGRWEAAGDAREVTRQRGWLMVLALMIHNIPEGLAVGAAYAGVIPGDSTTTQAGAAVAIAIGLQNMPEGLLVAMALHTLGQSKATAWSVAALTGLAEPLGALVGLQVLGGTPALYPVGLALAAGAMIFVVSHEIIPETHRHGFEGLSSATLMGGFIFMLMLDAAF
ncbi:ZIP family metal transporter [Hydrogenophaga sp. 5NK40-0174]|uniref:ZIP family metal transporter n=1 Tax=Hydrogenophaga sp. 5NK40-0174 TaxID=3127649 RepID=UPI003108AE04